MTQEDDSTYLPEKPESQTVLYRALDQLKHLAGTDRNSFFEPTLRHKAHSTGQDSEALGFKSAMPAIQAVFRGNLCIVESNLNP